MDEKAFKQMMKLIQEMGWNFDVSEKDRTKMEADNKMTPKIAVALQEGCDALEDLVEEALKFMEQLRSSTQSAKCEDMSKKLVKVVENARDAHRRLCRL